MNANWKTLLLAAALLALAPRVRAQTGALAPYQPVEGRIDGDPQTWMFTGLTGEPLSFRVETTSGDLDPILTIRDEAGQVLIANDDYNYLDSRDALLEAVSIPALGTYSATVSAFGETAGDYRLTMLPGYAQPAYDDAFDGAGAWRATSDALSLANADGALRLALAAGQPRGIAVDDDGGILTDFHAQVRVANISGGGWVVGMTARQQGDSYALFEVNDRGEWRFSVQTPDGETLLRDWVRHPAIRTDQTGFTLEIMTMGTGYDLFYNRVILGRFSTPLVDSGRIGLVVGTTRTTGGATSADFDDLRVTVPAEAGGQAIIPQQVVITPPQGMVQQLTRLRLMPAHGELTLNVSESFAESSRPGVEILRLASNLTFTNLAIGTTIHTQGSAPGMGGCGLLFRAADDTHYALAYLDRSGGYGVSQRDGDSFQPGLYGENPAFADGDSHNLLIIANDNTLHYYVDGQHVGTLENPPVTGGVGNAVVNFEPIRTSCSFNNTWVWRWD